MIAEEVNYCPRCGTQLTLETKFGRERPVCPACGWVFFPDPKVAVAVLVEQDAKVLLVRRSIDPKRGCWTLPAGFLDAGEHPAQAAERECLEETGLKVQVSELIDVLSGQEHPRGAHIILFYRADIISGTLFPNDDVDRAAFFALDSLPQLAFESTRQILNRAR
ncbi:MAG TPA: NUDIX hydrolase [Anaerolineales bacterium]|nr:NUDIX hydrolase [Anaerolineales bacterium]